MKKLFMFIFLVLFLSLTVSAVDLEVVDINTLQYISKFAINETGGEIANLDCSVNGCIYELRPPEDEIWIISRLVFQLQSTSKISSAGYGGGAALTNGIELHLNQSDLRYNLTNTQFIKTNAGWAKYCYDVSISDFGVGDEYLTARWTFTRSGTFLLLNGSAGDNIHLHLHDDFSSLVSQTFLFQGFKVPPVLIDGEDESMNIAIIIGIGVFAAALLFIAFRLDEDHFILKLLMLFFSLVSLILIPASLLGTIQATATNFMRLIYGSFTIFIIYFSVYLVYYQFKKSEKFTRGIN